MKKKFALLILATLIVLVTATPVLAGRGGGGGGKPQTFSLVGTITAVDNDTITVQALNARFAGQVLTVQLTGSTRFMQWTPDGRLPITLADVTVGDSTNVKGTMSNGEFIASLVTVDVPLYCFK